MKQIDLKYRECEQTLKNHQTYYKNGCEANATLYRMTVKSPEFVSSYQLWITVKDKLSDVKNGPAVA